MLHRRAKFALDAEDHLLIAELNVQLKKPFATSATKKAIFTVAASVKICQQWKLTTTLTQHTWTQSLQQENQLGLQKFS